MDNGEKWQLLRLYADIRSDRGQERVGMCVVVGLSKGEWDICFGKQSVGKRATLGREEGGGDVGGWNGL